MNPPPPSSRSGNRGGAAVLCSSPEDQVFCESIDNRDGTYELVWRSERAGLFEAHITIDGAHIIGSPSTVQLRHRQAKTLERGHRNGRIQELTRASTSSCGRHARCIVDSRLSKWRYLLALFFWRFLLVKRGNPRITPYEPDFAIWRGAGTRSRVSFQGTIPH